MSRCCLAVWPDGDACFALWTGSELGIKSFPDAAHLTLTRRSMVARNRFSPDGIKLRGSRELHGNRTAVEFAFKGLCKKGGGY